MDTKEILQLALAVLGYFAMKKIDSFKESLDSTNEILNKATDSIGELNVKIGVVIERTERHDEEIKEMKNNHVQFRERLHDFGNHINQIKGRIERD